MSFSLTRPPIFLLLAVLVLATSAEGTSLAVGEKHSCALRTGGTIKCWGYYAFLGGGTVSSDRYTPVDVIIVDDEWAITTATSLAAGFSHSCALLTGGTIKCWGNNNIGQLGDGTTTDRTTPVDVSGITTATSIALGGYHSCALLTGGAIKCWGYNNKGQLGDGTTTDRTNPVTVIGPPRITTATSIALGGYHSCALLTGGAIMCWGSNNKGQFGDETTMDRAFPVNDVSGISTAISIALGEDHSCALLTGGAIKCWGDNYYGQLGAVVDTGDVATTKRTTPVDVPGISTATSLAAGFRHSCALLTGGVIKCWGSNSAGQLGDGNTTQSTTPVDVTGLATASSVLSLSTGDVYNFDREDPLQRGSCPSFGACTNICRGGYTITKNSDTSYTFTSTQTPSGPDCVCYIVTLEGKAGSNYFSGKAADTSFILKQTSATELYLEAKHVSIGECTWTYYKAVSSAARSFSPITLVFVSFALNALFA